MMRAVRFLPEALEDLITTQRWYSSREPGLEKDFAEAIEAAIKRILNDPAEFPASTGRCDAWWCGAFPMPSISGKWAMSS